MTMTQCGWPWAAEEKAQGGEGWHGLPSPEPDEVVTGAHSTEEMRHGRTLLFGVHVTVIHPGIQDMIVCSFT